MTPSTANRKDNTLSSTTWLFYTATVSVACCRTGLYLEVHHYYSAVQDAGTRNHTVVYVYNTHLTVWTWTWEFVCLPFQFSNEYWNIHSFFSPLIERCLRLQAALASIRNGAIAHCSPWVRVSFHSVTLCNGLPTHPCFVVDGIGRVRLVRTPSLSRTHDKQTTHHRV